MRFVAILATIALVAVVAWEFVLKDRGAGFASRGRLSMDRAATGTLSSDDPSGQQRGPYHVWALRGSEGDRVTIDMTSSMFDSYLTVQDENGVDIASDDDGGDGLNARVRVVLPRSGTYRVLAGSYRNGASGDYQVTVSRWITPDVPGPGRGSSIAVGETKDGMLEPGDETGGQGPWRDRWTVALAEGQRVRIEMRSEDLDSYLVVEGPNGQEVARNDDGGAGRLNAAVVVRAAAAGSYTAIATSFGSQSISGVYRMQVSEVTGEFGDPGAVIALTEGQTVTGQLEAGDATGPTGSYMDVYTFSPTRAGIATIDMTSEAFDAYLEIEDANGQQIGRDDDGGGGRNARLMVSVNAGATYRVIARAFGGSAQGVYRIGALVGAAVNAKQ